MVARFLEWRGTTGSPEGLRQETRQLGRGPLPSTKVCLAQRAEARGTLDEGATMGLMYWERKVPNHDWYWYNFYN